ncbi:MAG: CsbD family protein [Terriglobales bacterium]
MAKENVEGKMKDVGGRIQRQAGEWTGNEEQQAEGAKKQAEGKAQDLWGKVKDSARDIKEDVQKRMKRDERDKDEKAA